MSIDQHDSKKIYCRKMGHQLTFSYCRKPASAQPCRKIFDCWFKTFDVAQFMQEHFTEEQIKATLAPPKAKVNSLIELIQQAQENAKKQGSE
jgi:hypothetical protein